MRNNSSEFEILLSVFSARIQYVNNRDNGRRMTVKEIKAEKRKEPSNHMKSPMVAAISDKKTATI